MSGNSVLFVSSEVHPLAKTGGLADVAGALPSALAEQGFEMRILLPAYPGTLEQADAKPLPGALDSLHLAHHADLHLGTMPETGLPVYLLECPDLYDRHGGLYVGPNGHDWPDNAERFSLLSRVAALFGCEEGLAGWRADLLHCNDWQTGLTPAYLHYHPHSHARTIFGIHNLAFTGSYPENLLGMLGLPLSSYAADGVEFFGAISFLKAGIYYADHITTVSPTYAQEIQTDDYGYGLEGLLHWRNESLTGILNGIDTQHWNPATDSFLPARYNRDKLGGKKACRRALQKRLGLSDETDLAILGMVSRMTWQKGVDLVLDKVEKLMEQPVQLVVLGSGDAAFEQRWLEFAQRFPERISVTIGYDEELSHWIEAGSDIFLMPSRYEPCGLNQLYSMAYGTPPVARHTGGLADSIVDTSPRSLADGTATGFLFENAADGNEFYACLMRALLAFQSKKIWRTIQHGGMQRDFSWTASAEQYADLYHALLS